MKKRNLLQKLNNGFHILKKSILHFGENRPIELAGTTAYFATFSMVPILIIIISIFGYFAGEETIRDKLFNELNVLIGHEGSSLLQKAIVNYEITKNSRLGTIIGIGFFLFSATTLFSTMQIPLITFGE